MEAITVADEIEKLNGGITDFNFDDLTVEELEQRLELAIGIVAGLDSPNTCLKTFTCTRGFLCLAPADYACTNGFGCAGF